MKRGWLDLDSNGLEWTIIGAFTALAALSYGLNGARGWDSLAPFNVFLFVFFMNGIYLYLDRKRVDEIHSGQGDGWGAILRAWAPAFALPWIYTAFRVGRVDLLVVRTLGIHEADAILLAADRTLFGDLFPLVMRSWLEQGWFLKAMTFFYVAVYPFWFFGNLFWWRAKGVEDAFWRIRRAGTIGCLVGFLGYLLVPASDPHLLFRELFGEQFPTRHLFGAPALFVSTHVYLDWKYAFDAYPSFHAMMAWIPVLAAWRYGGVAYRVIAAAVASLISLAAACLGGHYGVDVLAGMGIALCLGVLMGSVWPVAKAIPVESMPEATREAQRDVQVS